MGFIKKSRSRRSQTTIFHMEKMTFDLKFLTPLEISEMFQVPIRTIHALARQGKIPGIKIGKLWRFRQGDIWRWIESGYQKTPDMEEIQRTAREIILDI